MKNTRTAAAKKEIEVGGSEKDSKSKAACGSKDLCGSKTIKENKESAKKKKIHDLYCATKNSEINEL